ncbi:MAG TPA: alpha/beta hydrolase [Rhizobiaceae bacterium]|nr:alpha/beta hydrolase [Rhizobiaceae bacterium]
MHNDMLKAPDAEIYYETRGTGPLLLIIPGGPQDAGVFAGLAVRLADRYTVASYDPRGNSRTTVEGGLVDLDMNVQADDAAALIDRLGDGQAYVFGTSGGAQIGLSLAAKHPEKVRALIAHEPPTIMLLDDPSEALAADEDIYQTYKSDGVDAAMGKFFGMAELDPGMPEGEVPAGEGGPDFGDMPPEAAETFARVSGNFEYWLAHGMKPLGHYIPDVATLKKGKPRITVAIGEGSAGMPIDEMGKALARKLGIAATSFPGDHMGFETHEEEFAKAIDQALKTK